MHLYYFCHPAKSKAMHKIHISTLAQRICSCQLCVGSVTSAAYAVEKCDVLMQEVFDACHEYVSPVGYQLQCRADVCKCGAPCLCSILAHYARTCRRHGVIIEFRSHVPECGKSDTFTYYRDTELYPCCVRG